ncbi:MAG: uracil-DNA glycosylase [Anaerolinea sp.]|nr:uracil-DNA glycosylase [Anaerolinea sp.]
MTADETMREIAKQVTICEKCELHFSRKNAVPGEGPVNAQILFIGEGPGFHENEQGRPFVGQAGKFLDELLTHAGLKREEVFITNVVKCRPPSNRDPLPEELNACGNYLDKQIESINPWVIVTLGRFSMAKYLPMARISAIHGKPAWVGDRLILPMYHPAAALHQPKLKSDIITDFVGLPKAIEQAQKVRKINLEPIIEETYQTSSATESPEQLSLF